MGSTNTDDARPRVKIVASKGSFPDAICHSSGSEDLSDSKQRDSLSKRVRNHRLKCAVTAQYRISHASRPGLRFNGNKAARNNNNMALLLNRKYPKNLSREKTKGLWDQ